MVVVSAKAAFLALARIPVMVDESFHLHRGATTLSWTIHSVTATHAGVVSDDLMKLTPQIRISGALQFVVGA